MKEKSLELAKDLSARSIIKIKVGAVIYNKNKIIAWGWNNPGSGYGDHAEAMAIRRFNRIRGNDKYNNCRIVVYSSRKGKRITSRPCENCEILLRKAGIKGSAFYRKEQLGNKFVSYLVDEEYE